MLTTFVTYCYIELVFPQNLRWEQVVKVFDFTFGPQILGRALKLASSFLTHPVLHEQKRQTLCTSLGTLAPQEQPSQQATVYDVLIFLSIHTLTCILYTGCVYCIQILVTEFRRGPTFSIILHQKSLWSTINALLISLLCIVDIARSLCGFGCYVQLVQTKQLQKLRRGSCFLRWRRSIHFFVMNHSYLNRCKSR